MHEHDHQYKCGLCGFETDDKAKWREHIWECG